ncbi:hypothetical protein DFJ67_1861 [Asanoa ferruginea]|uniref:Uncharacterized protein n=1 Tax=Asanoa ferruginea TaxID=53367 RepID=A0A3D9ZEP1_9ACTN|nr:hypothetical protein [Asanoa ferruginea]REF95898.1 hypothetical protein DFJ67_1861 [Asanoa ferruginea]GIF50729.1 hypothetical protein Afe04nite_52680 [Asanoa ferruginea]
MTTPQAGFANPFPSTANASGQPVDPDLAVHTPAVTTAAALFDAFLRGGQQGEVLAVIGGAGTGKTYLSGVLRGMADQAQPPVRSFYAQVSATSFQGVLGSFVRAVKRDESTVRAGVRHLFAQVVADALGDSDLGRHLGPELRGGKLDPVTLVQRMRLDRGAYLETLTTRLEQLTDHPGIATALTLLLRPGFDHAVWTWLAGGEPAGVLRDRRIAAALESDADALRAMGALISVICAPGRKILLTFDELERTFRADRPLTEETTTALRRFLASAVNAGAFVVLSGFTSFLENVPEDVRYRIGPTIQTSPFQPEDIQQLVNTSREAVRDQATAPPPFSPKVVEHLADLTAGVPRLIVDLSHRLVRATRPATTTIDEAAIETAAQAYVEERHGAYFAEEVRRALTEQGWKVEPNRYVGLSQDSHVDFWVADTDGGEGCAILVAENVIGAADVNRQRDRIFTVKEGLPTGEILLVVKGFLAQGAERELTDLTGRRPLVAQPGRIGRDLGRTVRAILASFEAHDPVERVGNRLDRLGQHQATMHGYVAQLALSMNELRTANEKHLAEIIGRLQPPEPQGAQGTPAHLPPAVEAMLDDAQHVLAELLGRVDTLFTDALHAGPDRARDTRMALRARLRQRNTAAAAGVVALLQRLIAAFREELRLWYAEESPAGAAGRDTRTLDALCQTYSVACEYLPLFQLDELRHVTARFADVDDLPTERTTEIRASELFGNLAGRVQTELTGPTAMRRRAT